MPKVVPERRFPRSMCFDSFSDVLTSLREADRRTREREGRQQAHVARVLMVPLEHWEATACGEGAFARLLSKPGVMLEVVRQLRARESPPDLSAVVGRAITNESLHTLNALVCADPLIEVPLAAFVDYYQQPARYLPANLETTRDVVRAVNRCIGTWRQCMTRDRDNALVAHVLAAGLCFGVCEVLFRPKCVPAPVYRWRPEEVVVLRQALASPHAALDIVAEVEDRALAASLQALVPSL